MSRRSPFAPAAVLAVAMTFLTSCEPPAAPERPLPDYDGKMTQVFDDQIEPSAVGLALESGLPPGYDPKLRERVQTSDATVRVRVETLTEKHEDRGTSYVVGLRREEVYGGSYPPPETFQVHIGTQGASHGVVNSFGARLVGRKFLATVRQFSHGGAGGATGDEHDLHFHFYSDNERTVEAVHSAFALASFR